MINGYVTSAEFLQWVTPQDTTADTVDDVVIDSIIEAASRYVDGSCSRTFYPRVETRYYSIPDSRELSVDSDLLSVISLANGDDSSIASTEYNLFPRNKTPHAGLKLKAGSDYWLADGDGEVEWVIALAAMWGFHNNYDQRGWVSGGTLDGAIADTTTLAFTMTSGHTLAKDQIIKIDNELYNISAVATNSITPLYRGDNGSTAATHLDLAEVYIWQTQEDISQAVKLIAQSLYRRFGHPNQSDESIVTASGVIITPKDIPGMAARTLSLYRQKL